MKKAKFTVFLSMISCLAGSVANSQNITPKEVNSKIVKSWSATEVGTPGEALFPKKNKEIMDFRADGSLHIQQESKMTGTMTLEAKWHFDEKMQRLIMTIEMGDKKEEQSIEIIELTDIRLVLMSPRKQTAYIPSDMVIEDTPTAVEVSSGGESTGNIMDPTIWTGRLDYNTVLVGDDDGDIEEKVSGTIILSKVDGKKIINKSENSKSITWTITGDIEIAGITRYDAECSDTKLSGEITFQNGGMMVEIYDPEYKSYFFIPK